MAFPADDSGAYRSTMIDLKNLPSGANFLRIMGVNYVHMKTADGGDLYLTEYGVPFREHLKPENWYEEEYFRAKRQRLEGTSAVYKVPTRPHHRFVCRSIDLVVKWSRVGQDVPLDTFTLNKAINAEFNTPFEEFSLVEELRQGSFGPSDLQHPDAEADGDLCPAGADAALAERPLTRQDRWQGRPASRHRDRHSSLLHPAVCLGEGIQCC